MTGLELTDQTMHPLGEAADPSTSSMLGPTCRLYLGEEQSGVGWLLDPASDRLRYLVDRSQVETPSSPAEYENYLADADLLRQLLLQRHPACLGNTMNVHRIDTIVSNWTVRLARQRPRTHLGCVGSLGYDLGRALGDAHLRCLYERRPPHAKLAAPREPGPPWHSWTHDGIRVVRMRSLDSSRFAAELEAGVDESDDDFAHSQIMIDLRGNPGGDDEYVLRWMQSHIPRPTQLHAPSLELRVQDARLNSWNIVSMHDLLGAELPVGFRAATHRPDPSDVLSYEEVDDGSVAAGSVPWHGDMVIVIDGGTASSAESAALMLREAFGARIVGSNSYGSIDYGNVCPYVLPNSGLQVQIPTRKNEWPFAIDFCGIRPEIPVDIERPVDQLVEQFHELFEEGAAV